MPHIGSHEQRILGAITGGLPDAGSIDRGWVMDRHTRSQLRLCQQLVIAKVADGAGEGAGIRKLFPLTMRRVFATARLPAAQFVAAFVASRAFTRYSAIPFAYPGSSLLHQFYQFATAFAVQRRDPGLRLAIRLDAARYVTQAVCAGRARDSELSARIGLRLSRTASFCIISAPRGAFEVIGLVPSSGAKHALYMEAAAANWHVEGFVADAVARVLRSCSRRAGDPTDAPLPVPCGDTPLLRALRQKRLI